MNELKIKIKEIVLLKSLVGLMLFTACNPEPFPSRFDQNKIPKPYIRCESQVETILNNLGSDLIKSLRTSLTTGVLPNNSGLAFEKTIFDDTIFNSMLNKDGKNDPEIVKTETSKCIEKYNLLVRMCNVTKTTLKPCSYESKLKKNKIETFPGYTPLAPICTGIIPALKANTAMLKDRAFQLGWFEVANSPLDEIQ